MSQQLDVRENADHVEDADDGVEDIYGTFVTQSARASLKAADLGYYGCSSDTRYRLKRLAKTSEEHRNACGPFDKYELKIILKKLIFNYEFRRCFRARNKNVWAVTVQTFKKY